MKTREIEMYVGTYAGNAKTWDTSFVDIPADTPDDQISEVAERILRAELEQNPDTTVAFVGVYNIPEMMENDPFGDDAV